MARGAEGTAADAQVAKWTAALNSGDEQARLEAIDALGQMGPAAAKATEALADQLSDKSADVRAHAAFALHNIGPAASAAAPALAKAIADPDKHTRRMATAALERIHPEPALVVEALGKALEDEDPSVRVAALNTLTEYGEAAVPILSKALASPKAAYWAALALGELGPKASGAVDELVAALKGTHETQVRREVLIALARIGSAAASAVPAIEPLLNNADPGIAYAAGYALGSFGPAAASAADALRAKIHSQDMLEDCVCCWALAKIEPDNKKVRDDAIEHLLAALKSDDPRVQSAVLRGLMELEPSPEQLVPALGYVIANGQEPAVGEALGALAALGEPAVEVLDDALKRPEARYRAALLITHLGPKAKSTVPELIAGLDDKDPDVRREVLFALAAIGPEAAAATGAVSDQLADPEPRNAAVAAYTLGRIGPAAASALPKLQEELTASDPLVRVASAFALVHVAPGNESLISSTLPVLVQGLKNPLPAARRGAAEALGDVGKPARSLAEGPLRQAAQDTDESVRLAALEALERMGAVVDAPPESQVRPKTLERRQEK